MVRTDKRDIVFIWYYLQVPISFHVTEKHYRLIILDFGAQNNH